MAKDKRNPRLSITLTEAYNMLLERYVESVGDKPSTFAAYAVQKELDKLREEGTIDLASQINEISQNLEYLVDFIENLAGEKGREVDLEVIAKITNLSKEKLELLQKMCLCGQRNTPKRSAFKKKTNEEPGQCQS